jgi:cell fate (sporulation/competence/biofilm development) regulator YlbF (YheA/YmcA/DUF963 family)
MQLTSTESPIVEKTRELCQTILDHPDFQSIRSNIDSFMSDDTAKNDYQNLMEKGEELNHKQNQGVRLSPEEISQYEAQRDKVVNNPVSAAFIQAQQEVQEIQQSINTYLSKTLELGRVPSADELGGGGCGSGCGCHH